MCFFSLLLLFFAPCFPEKRTRRRGKKKPGKHNDAPRGLKKVQDTLGGLRLIFVAKNQSLESKKRKTRIKPPRESLFKGKGLGECTFKKTEIWKSNKFENFPITFALYFSILEFTAKKSVERMRCNSMRTTKHTHFFPPPSLQSRGKRFPKDWRLGKEETFPRFNFQLKCANTGEPNAMKIARLVRERRD